MRGPFTRKFHRSTLVAVSIGASVALASACNPPPVAAPSTVVATGTPVCAGPTPAALPPRTASAGGGGGGGAAGGTAPAEVLTGEELRAEVHDAVAAAQAGPIDRVVVTAMTADGPVVHAVEPGAADAVARFIDAVPGTDVVAVEPDEPVRVAATWQSQDPLRPRLWAFNMHDVEVAWACGQGAGARVAVVDTGVDGTHPDLRGRVERGTAFLSATPNVTRGDEDPFGHGTHVAGTIAAGTGDGLGITGVAPAARIVPVRVLDEIGNGSTSDLAAGILWAVNESVDVINLSLVTTGNLDGAVARAIDAAVAAGVTVVAAAGNGGPTGPVMLPGSAPATIAVGALGTNGLIAPFSTHGPHVDVVAAGVDILSTLPAGAWRSASGTSMAAPHVTGLVALLCGANPACTPAWVRSRIEGTVLDVGAVGPDPATGRGVIQPAKAVGARLG